MSDNKKKPAVDANSQFRTTQRIKTLENLYADDSSTRRRYDQSLKGSSSKLSTAAGVREALKKALTNNADIIEISKQLYATNPIYASVINYLRDMYTWKYRVIPHQIYSKSKAQARKPVKIDDYKVLYNLMLEIVEGLSFETKCPAILEKLFVEGSVYYTTLCDEDSFSVDTLLLPAKYCRKIGETQFGTSIINFDFSYFRDLGLKEEQLKDYLNSFPVEFTSGYNAYLKDSTQRWGQLDPRFSSGIMMNEQGVPTFIYILGGILDFEQYQDNELERNENALKYLVVHTIPHYEDQLIFEVDEVNAMHKSLKRIVDTGEKARLITTYGDIHVENISDSDTSENQVLSKAFKAIFNNAGFNSGIFTSESVKALEMSLIRDKGFVWKYVQELVNFYNIAVNSWFDFKGYQADIDILPISSYTLNDDIKVYKDNATLGVNKLDYLIASGIEQKHIPDMLLLEKTLGLDQITPMQTSYTQTAEDRVAEESSDSKDSKDQSKSGIEPSDKEQSQQSEETTKNDQTTAED